MTRFLIRRIVLGAVVLWVITTSVFVMFYVAPHDVARAIAGRQATPDTVAAVSRRLSRCRGCPVATPPLSFATCGYRSAISGV